MNSCNGAFFKFSTLRKLYLIISVLYMSSVPMRVFCWIETPATPQFSWEKKKKNKTHELSEYFSCFEKSCMKSSFRIWKIYQRLIIEVWTGQRNIMVDWQDAVVIANKRQFNWHFGVDMLFALTPTSIQCLFVLNAESGTKRYYQGYTCVILVRREIEGKKRWMRKCGGTKSSSSQLKAFRVPGN